MRPIVSSIHLIDTRTNKKWKRDGYKYQPRANGKGFREISKLLGQYKHITCLYSTIDSQDEIYNLTNLNHPDVSLRQLLHKLDNLNTEYVQRRIFKLSNSDSEPSNNLHLVQYFIKPSELNKIKNLESKSDQCLVKKAIFSEEASSNDISTYDE